MTDEKETCLMWAESLTGQGHIRYVKLHSDTVHLHSESDTVFTYVYMVIRGVYAQVYARVYMYTS
jgi:hypothetical protein